VILLCAGEQGRAVKPGGGHSSRHAKPGGRLRPEASIRFARVLERGNRVRVLDSQSAADIALH